MKRSNCLLLLAFFYTVQSFAQSAADSNIIHVQDGRLTEWNPLRLTTDKESKISYAIDNDSKYLYIGLQMSDIATEIKMMRNGMSVYIDLKGKKKTGHSIEFPITQEIDQSGSPSNGQRPAWNGGEKPDPAVMKSNLIMMRNFMVPIRFNALKLSGFNTDESQQDLNVAGSIQVAYKCDTTEVVEIEYLVPLSMLGDVAVLNNKQISIGCEIHAMQMPSAPPVDPGATAPIGGAGRGSRGGGGGGGRAAGGGVPTSGVGSGGQNTSNGNTMNNDMMKEQSFWTKYTFSRI